MFKIVDTYEVSEYRENNVWQCDVCGFTVSYDSDGDAPCECPTCIGKESEIESNAVLEHSELCPNCNTTHEDTFGVCPDVIEHRHYEVQELDFDEQEQEQECDEDEEE